MSVVGNDHSELGKTTITLWPWAGQRRATYGGRRSVTASRAAAARAAGAV